MLKKNMDIKFSLKIKYTTYISINRHFGKIMNKFIKIKKINFNILQTQPLLIKTQV